MRERDLQLRGVKKRIDSAGRIFLPTDLRRELDINGGDEVEIFIVGDNEGIYVRLLKARED